CDTAVMWASFSEQRERALVVIKATILVDRESHKGIVIGGGGQGLKEIGLRARLELEALFDGNAVLLLVAPLCADPAQHEGARPVPGGAGLLVVAFVGRPNVGRSSLFNRLLGSRRA